MKFARPKFRAWFGKFIEQERRGQTLVEYTLILAILSILALAMMLQLTGNVRVIYSNIDTQVARSNNGS